MHDRPEGDHSVRKDRWRGDLNTRMDYERRRRWFNGILGAGCFLFWFFSIYNLNREDILPSYVPIFFAVLTSVWLGLIYVYRGPAFLVWSSRLFTLSLVGLISYYLALGGDGNARALWANTFPMIAIFMLGRIEGSIWITIFVLLHLMIVFNPGLPVSGPKFDTGFALRYFLSLSVIIIMTYSFETGRHRVMGILRRNQELLKASEKRLRFAYEELKTAQSQLVQSGKLASIGELAAGVAHELNQPLMVIRGNTQLLERKIAKNQEAETLDLASFFFTIDRNTKRMSTIIDHLRSFSRQSSKTFAPVDINKVINDTFLMIGEQLRIRGVEVEKRLSPSLPEVLGDAYQLEQVFLNLISNARDALIDRFTLSRKDAPPKRLVIITRPMNNEARQIEILFEDNGSGIPRKHLDTIFDPFFTTKKAGKGTGLGLSISYGIVKDHDGTTEVMQTGNQGTVLRIVLPTIDPSDCPEGTPQSPIGADTTDGPAMELDRPH